MKSNNRTPKKLTKYNHRADPIDVASNLQETKNLPVQYISEILDKAYNAGNLENESFYFISVNYFLKREGVYVWPCELAVSEFSIKNGVIRTMHTVS